MQQNPGQKIIEKIKKEKIVPKSKTFWNWKNYLFWSILAVAMLLNALFFSFIVLNLLDIHLGVFRHLGPGRVFFIFFRTAPYFWFLLLILMAIVGFLALRKTRHGYRYEVLLSIIGGFLIVATLGGIFHLTKINRHLGDKMLVTRGFSREMAFPIEKRWCSPEHGMLGGEVLLTRKDSFDLRGFDDSVWEVYYSDKTQFRIRTLRPKMFLEVVGKKSGEREFRAFIIQPFPFERNVPMR